VLEALHYIHGKDLVHGDITPANVIVATDGSAQPKLIDFGLSVPAGARPAGWHPRFGAPEVIAGESTTQLSDIFGFGATMVHTMLGRSPGHVSEAGYTTDPPTDAELEAWGAEGSPLLKVFFHAAAADPGVRPSSAGKLREILASTDIVVRPQGQAEEREYQINPNVDAIRRLYRASAIGNAGNRGLDDEFSKLTYVPTRLDTDLVPQVLDGRLDVVLLSGNPGDGKTSLLVRLADELVRRGATVDHRDEAGWQIRLRDRTFYAVYDASESHGDLSSDDLVRQALMPAAYQHNGPATALIAINDGRLLQFFTDHEGDFEDLKLAIDAQLEGDEPGDSRLVLVDLKRRSLASMPGEDGLASRALAELTQEDRWGVCGTCRAQPNCPIFANRSLLAGPGADTFAELTRISHLRRRRRATFRDVRSAAAWLVSGDRGCTDIHELDRQGRDIRQLADAQAFDLAFSRKSNDYLVDEWADVDPGVVSAPVVDEIRRAQRGNAESRINKYSSVSSVARALYFGDTVHKDVHRNQLRAYRYLTEFEQMLAGTQPSDPLRRILLGISRLAGAFGFSAPGLAMSSGMPDSDWAVLHTIPESKFGLRRGAHKSPFIETMPDHLTLQHEAGPSLALTLDTAEIILRAADGEIIDDFGSDSIRQEIDSFVNQLGRQPSSSALIVDSSGSVAVAVREEQLIRLEK
jgi:hypothetical protein